MFRSSLITVNQQKETPMRFPVLKPHAIALVACCTLAVALWSPPAITAADTQTPTVAPPAPATATPPATNAAPAAETKKPDVIYVPTPQPIVDKMLELAEVKKGDVVYDLGCGDGRIVVTAAKKYGVKAVGFDVDPVRIREANENVRTNNVGALVSIRQQDIFTLDLREASVVTLYLLPELNVRLMPQLAKLKPGSRIVSHDFDMEGAKAVVTHEMNAAGEYDDDEDGEESGTGHTIYKWVVPWEKEEGNK